MALKIRRTATKPGCTAVFTIVIFHKILYNIVDYIINSNKTVHVRGVHMTIKHYDKLVRDRIPEIIESDGKNCVTEILSSEQYLQKLDAKLNEELAEYQESKSLEELADLLEVIQAVVKSRGWTLEELEQVRADKAAKRGGFEARLLLKEVRED